ncbi:MAG: hypothetical protein KBD39_06225 [Sterolibacterium sp.]|nr:hypothetical protein [Sterolibacterium sp.]MBP9799700.1 hypothetical protein [Sterolibacterium sp.]
MKLDTQRLARVFRAAHEGCLANADDANFITQCTHANCSSCIASLNHFYRLATSFPRKRESSFLAGTWIPACAGMTKRNLRGNDGTEPAQASPGHVQKITCCSTSRA